jgi:hypothetical protein
MRILLLSILLSFFAGETNAQKFLQLEKIHSPKTKKYFPGQEITFQLHGGQWYTRVIEDINYEQNLLLFPRDHVHLDSIAALRFFDRQKWSRPLSNQFFNFAAVWVVYAAIDELVSGNDFKNLDKSVYMIPASSVATGFLIRHLFKKKTYRFEKNKKGEAKRWRLRVLDLNIKGELKKP